MRRNEECPPVARLTKEAASVDPEEIENDQEEADAEEVEEEEEEADDPSAADDAI